MGVRNTEDEGVVALFDSVSGHAFGLTFDSTTEAEAFLEFAENLGIDDVRKLNDAGFDRLHAVWLESLEEDEETE